MKHSSFFPQPFKNVKTILSSQSVRKTDGGLDLARGLYFADPRIGSSLKTVPALILHLDGRKTRGLRLGEFRSANMPGKGSRDRLNSFLFLKKSLSFF